MKRCSKTAGHIGGLPHNIMREKEAEAVREFGDNLD
jgi:hypothetical protein